MGKTLLVEVEYLMHRHTLRECIFFRSCSGNLVYFIVHTHSDRGSPWDTTLITFLASFEAHPCQKVQKRSSYWNYP